MRISFVLALGGILFLGGYTTSVEAAGLSQRLVPHRAVYAMNLSKTGSGGGLTGARGVMTYEFRDRCDAWTVESKVYLRLRYGGHPEVENIRSMVTWEAKDGLGFRFRLTEVTNGKTTEEIKGVAALDGIGLGGVAEFTKPSPKKMALPNGTLFPTAHIQTLIQHSLDGGKHMTKTIFDGATMENPYEVSAVIGKGPGTKSLSPKLAKILSDAANWKMRMAYFPVRDKKQTPELELGVEIRADGIVKRILQDFGEYAVEARLDQVEFLKDSGC
jgi:hypothetical protein